MLDDMTQMIKEKLLEDLIEKMSGGIGDEMKPKGMGVEVQAKDPASLKEGLDKAKDLLGKGEMPEGEGGSASHEGSEEDDERRLMALLGDEDDDEKEA